MEHHGVYRKEDRVEATETIPLTATTARTSTAAARLRRHVQHSSRQSRFEETAQWYYDGLQNVDDLYPAPGALDNMPDEYEDGRTTYNLTPPRSRPTSAAGHSGTATPTPTTGVADIPTSPRRRFKAGTVGGTRPHRTTVPASRYCPRGPPRVRTHRYESVIQSFQKLRKDFESRIQDRLEIVLDEIRDSDLRRKEQHDEIMCMFRSSRHNDDQSHTPLADSLYMSQHVRSYDPLDPPMMAQQTPEVQDPLVMAQQSAEVQGP
ncbi:hypothetical protein QYF36_023404 [Acer negundo]|nr:hypothetical protein QYF36_023404 [Acer negundo]